MTSAPGTAIVTGAASGLGKAIVARLQADGWKVAGFDLAGADGDSTFDVDVTDVAGVNAAVEAVAGQFGAINGLAHCAGAFRNRLLPVHLLDDDTWLETIGVNLTGSFNVARATLPHLMNSRGSLVMTASTGADHSQPGGAAYSAAKAGIRMLTRSIALEYAHHGVRACSVSPGYMRTGMTARVLERPDILANIEASIPVGRVSDPSEVANLFAFLLSDQAGFLTGEDIVIDGGGNLMTYVGNGEVAAMWARVESRAAASSTP